MSKSARMKNKPFFFPLFFVDIVKKNSLYIIRVRILQELIVKNLGIIILKIKFFLFFLKKLKIKFCDT